MKVTSWVTGETNEQNWLQRDITTLERETQYKICVKRKKTKGKMLTTYVSYEGKQKKQSKSEK